MSETPKNAFEEAGQQPPQGGFLRELWEFLSHNKKWWMLPIIAIMLLLGALLWLSTTAAAPFIYTLF